MSRPLILVGGGGHCKSVIEAAEGAGYEIKGILDLPPAIGNIILGYEVIGCDEDILHYANSYDFVITVGSLKNPGVRIKLHELIKSAGGHLATIVASTAHVSKHATVGEGTVVLHQATVNAGAKIGKSVIINSGANIEHDAEVGDFSHVSTGAMVNGDCKIGAGSFIGSQSVLGNGVEVISRTVIGAGTVVIKNICKAGLYVGNPAVLKKEI